MKAPPSCRANSQLSSAVPDVADVKPARRAGAKRTIGGGAGFADVLLMARKVALEPENSRLRNQVERFRRVATARR